MVVLTLEQWLYPIMARATVFGLRPVAQLGAVLPLILAATSQSLGKQVAYLKLQSSRVTQAQATSKATTKIMTALKKALKSQP